MMRKLKLILFIFCLSASLFAQTKSEAISALKKELQTTNYKFPIKVGAFTMTDIEIKGNDYIIYMEIDETQQNLDEYIKHMSQHKSEFYSLVSGQRKETSKLFVTSGLNLVFDIKGKQSAGNKKITLSSAEIEEAYQMCYSAKDLINDFVIEMRKDLPEDFGYGLTCTDIYIDEDFICYKVKTNETYITMPLLKQAKLEGHDMENSIIEEFINTDGVMEKLFINYIMQSNMGLRYIYWSDQSPDVVTFTIPSAELKKRIH